MVIKIHRLLYFFIIGCLLWASSGWLLSEAAQFLITEKPLANPDVIIILGGDTGPRIDYGARLYHNLCPHPPLLMTAGSYFLEPMSLTMKRYAMEKWKVPSRDILIETCSTSTYENAKFCYPIIQKHGFKRVLVVTSDYHTGRSLHIFQKVFKDPTITLGILKGTDEVKVSSWWKDSAMTELVVLEWVKTVVYWWRY
jgi:uncharacterized SAM-binding protein YcdF (DUF218 family)